MEAWDEDSRGAQPSGKCSLTRACLGPPTWNLKLKRLGGKFEVGTEEKGGDERKEEGERDEGRDEETK